ncbi:AAC(3) family N-acetyltransferase [Flavobacteriaceae bacterium]|nr:AAC(3) family N-acetyltransferase [Flavobacteriaceae bacterium]
MIKKIKVTLSGFSGKNVLVHSDIFNGFKSNNFKSRKELLKEQINFVEEISGEKNLVFPTFNYDFLKNGTYSIDNDKSQVGVLSEYFRSQKSIFRTNEPVFNFSSSKKLDFKRIDSLIDPFDKYSFFNYLYDNNDTILHYGSPFSSTTFLHYIERKSGLLSYRYDKIFEGKIIYNDRVNPVKFLYHVRPMNEHLDYDNIKIENDLISNGIMFRLLDGRTSIMISNLKDMCDFIIDRLKIDPYYLLDNDSKKWIMPKVDKLGRGFILTDFE